MNNLESGGSGRLALQLPAGWTSTPASVPLHLRARRRAQHLPFTVAVPALENRDYRIDAVATVAGREYTQGYDVIEHRDLETRYLYHPATTSVRGVDVTIAPGLKVGYVMGIGDEVPAGIAQLGAAVTLLGEQDLASGDLRRFDAIMTGTRAYAVRDDLKTYNRRLLDYVQQGGNLIVLYNTQEFVPNSYAPFPAQLPRSAEEVSEEDSPVEILAPSQPVFTTPNRITKADFDGWVEQRGSKFFTEWDRGLHADDRDARSGSGAAERRLADRHLRQGALHLLRLRVPSPAAVRRPRRLPPAGEPAVARQIKKGRRDFSAPALLLIRILTPDLPGYPCHYWKVYRKLSIIM